MPVCQNEVQDRVLDRLTRWAEADLRIRALILTSSRTNPDAPVDPFSDYDVIVVTSDIRPFLDSEDWLEAVGRVLTVYRDPVKRYEGSDHETSCRVTHCHDGTKIDFTVWPVALLQQIAAAPGLPDDLDLGYEVLVGKDDLAADLAAPTGRAYILDRPSDRDYRDLVEEFLSETLYVAKNLWRDELLYMKLNLDHMLKGVILRRMLEWRVEIDHDWALRLGAHGRWLKRRLPSESWDALAATYVGAGEDVNWDALFRTIDLFHEVALGVGEALGYTYPQAKHDAVVARLHEVRQTPRRRAQSFPACGDGSCDHAA